MHRNATLWRVLHQMHHSAERVDTFGAFYFSPLDMVGFSILGSLCLAPIFGLDPQSTTIFLLVTMFLAMFQHANIRTPQWLGYIIQRPESHGVHHARRVMARIFQIYPFLTSSSGHLRIQKSVNMKRDFMTVLRQELLICCCFVTLVNSLWVVSLRRQKGSQRDDLNHE